LKVKEGKKIKNKNDGVEKSKKRKKRRNRGGRGRREDKMMTKENTSMYVSVCIRKR
jgi:hypothetical protein